MQGVMYSVGRDRSKRAACHDRHKSRVFGGGEVAGDFGIWQSYLG